MQSSCGFVLALLVSFADEMASVQDFEKGPGEAKLKSRSEMPLGSSHVGRAPEA